jgi:hypothetical protein
MDLAASRATGPQLIHTNAEQGADFRFDADIDFLPSGRAFEFETFHSDLRVGGALDLEQ